MTARKNGIGIPRQILGQPESASFVGSEVWHVRKRRNLHLLAIAKRAGIYTETMRPVVSAMVKAGVETAASFQRAFASINRIAASDASSLEELRKRSQK